MTSRIDKPSQCPRPEGSGGYHRKDNWAPVWTGLVMDQDAKHYQRMRNALWLFLYLILNANRKSGFLIRKVKTISTDTGIARDTVLRWLSILREHGYISTRFTGRCLLIQVKKWKVLSRAPRMPYQEPQISNCTVGRNPTPYKGPQNQNPVHLGQKKPDLGGLNNSILTKIY